MEYNKGYIQFICPDHVREKLEYDITQNGFNPKKDKSKWIRHLIMHEEIQFLKPEDLDVINMNFADLARVGGLLNQLCFHLHQDYITIQNGETSSYEVDKQDVIQTSQTSS